MCKAIDNLPPHEEAAAAATGTTTSEGNEQKDNNNNNNTKAKKRVRFRAATGITVFEKVTEPQEREAVWYNRNDFDDIRAEIGVVVEAKTNNDWRQRPNHEDWYCFRGLEFLKLDNNPSRKERRLLYARRVLVFQTVTRRKSAEPADLISAYCTKMSQDSKQRALSLANGDESEARSVYYECRLIYQDSDTGEDMCMFSDRDGNRRSSLCRGGKELSSEMSLGLLDAPLQDVFSYNTLCRVIRNVRDNTVTPLFTTRVN